MKERLNPKWLRPHLIILLFFFSPLSIYAFLNIFIQDYIPLKQVYVIIPLMASLTFAIVFITSAFTRLLKNNIISAFYAMNAGLLFLNVYFKMIYSPYNIFLTLIFLISIVIIDMGIFMRKLSDQVNIPLRIIMYDAFLLNIILISIPNEKIFEFFRNDEMIPWRKSITWADFKGQQTFYYNSGGENDTLQESQYVAEISTALIYKKSLLHIYPHVVVQATMNPYRSWVNAIEKDDYILLHEQMHFNICELFKRKINDSLSGYLFLSPAKSQQILDYFDNRMKEEQAVYDSLTRHGCDTGQQKKWNQRIIATLEKEGF